MRARILKLGVFLIIGLVALEGLGRYLQKANRAFPPGDPDFLLSTTWGQAGEYAAFAPAGEVMGCWAVAIAQLAHFHRLLPRGEVDFTTTSGIRIQESLGSIPFRFERILPVIHPGDPRESREETARYIYEVAVGIRKDFGGESVMDRDRFVERIRDHLGATARLHQFMKTEYLEGRERISAMIRREIDEERPLMLYFDNGKDWGHAAVIDGYVEWEGRLLVHLNMGWEGRDDGWYDPFDRIMGLRDDLQNRFLLTFRPLRETAS